MVQSASGYLADIRGLGRACRERGILLTIDGCQATGRVPVDVEDMCVDVFSSASFKGMLGVMGAGFCWCRREVMDRVAPAVVSGNLDWERYALEPGFSELPAPDFPRGAARMETGTQNNYGIRVMDESVRMLNEIGVERVAARIREVETYYRARLKAAKLNIHMLGSERPETWSGSVSFTYDPTLRPRLESALKDAEICAAVRGYFRVSLHFYNSCKDIDRLMAVIAPILSR